MILGAVISSFSATWALRRDRGDQAIVGRSRCDSCAHPLSFADTAPLLSFAVLKGHCRHCHAKISPFHLLAEGIGACLLAAILAFRPWPGAAVEGALAMVLLALAIVDFRSLILPNPCVAFAALLGFCLSVMQEQVGLNVITVLISWCILTAVAFAFKHWRGRTALGGGDIKLIAALSLWLGPDISLAVALASLLGLVQIKLLPARPGLIAFGPALIAGALVIGLLVRPWFSLGVAL